MVEKNCGPSSGNGELGPEQCHLPGHLTDHLLRSSRGPSTWRGHGVSSSKVLCRLPSSRPLGGYTHEPIPPGAACQGRMCTPNGTLRSSVRTTLAFPLQPQGGTAQAEHPQRSPDRRSQARNNLETVRPLQLGPAPRTSHPSKARTPYDPHLASVDGRHRLGPLMALDGHDPKEEPHPNCHPWVQPRTLPPSAGRRTWRHVTRAALGDDVTRGARARLGVR